jgi:hypothetical protein
MRVRDQNVKSSFRCSKCGHEGRRNHFRKYADDLAVGIKGPILCQRCQPRRIPVDYERRNRVLFLLGFKTYGHYLKSELWKTLRSIILKRDDYSCVVCGSAANNVHHNSYEVDVMIGKDHSQLLSLCRKHHEQAEFDRDGKSTLIEAREKLKNMGAIVPTLIKAAVPDALKIQDGFISKWRGGTPQILVGKRGAKNVGRTEEGRAIREFYGLGERDRLNHHQVNNYRNVMANGRP